jgi:hypothetical protein
VPLLDITFDYTKTNVFTVWWFLPYNRSSAEFDITFEDDMNCTIIFVKQEPYSNGLWNGLLEQNYSTCEKKGRLKS